MYIATYTIDIAALFCLIWFVYSSTALKIWRKRPFLIGIILILIVILSEAGTVFANDGSFNLRGLNVMCNVLGFSLSPLIPIAITLIFYEKILKRHKFILVPTLINIVATVLSPFFGIIFYVDENNHYFRGDHFFIFITVYIINFLFLVISTLDVSKKHNYPIMYKLLALSFFTLVGTSIQLVYPSAYSSWHCVILALLLYFILMSEFDSSFDTLTGLYNRAAFDKAAKQMAGKQAFFVIVIDINDFKIVNDTYGHGYGDTVIKAVAEIIRKTFNKHYTCYRIGGDEFAIIGSETDRKKIEYLLKNMTDNLTKMREDGKALPTVSYGYSISHKEEKLDFQNNFKEADDQMYHYKKNHKYDFAKEIVITREIDITQEMK